jgi:Ni,Fe-hydrogenase I large subunit
MTRIAIDPITRIEGHLRIEAQVDGGVVSDAWSSSTMFRGMEVVLRGRDPRDAWLFAQRICGVCTTVHALASVRAVEDALGIEIPDNARLIRNIIAGTQWVQDHVIHFYHLHALDWVDVMSALKADPGQTAKLAQSISPWPKSSRDYFKGVQDRLKAFAASGSSLGLFTNGYWGHPDYRLPPAANLMAVAHYLEALDWQREYIKVQAILGAKNPHPQTYLVGGMAIPVDPTSQAALNDERLEAQREMLVFAKTFVDQVYIPDLLAIGAAYKDWAKYGAGNGNYLCYGDYPTSGTHDPASFWMPRGMIEKRDLTHVLPLDEKLIGEYVTRSWYTYAEGDHVAKHPYDGETTPQYTGPKPPYEFLKTDAKYSWVKSPRYDDKAMEVGPLARMLVGYAGGHAQIRKAVDATLAALGIPLPALFSTLGRVVARGIETQLMAEQVLAWHDELVGNIKGGDLRVHDGRRWEPSTWPAESAGWGAHEGPRGSLGHWIRIKNGAVANYQAVVPTTWNASPRDPAGVRGPYEASLIGTPVADPNRPLEILRTVHSFDPCMACAVHVTDPGGRLIVRVEPGV